MFVLKCVFVLVKNTGEILTKPHRVYTLSTKKIVLMFGFKVAQDDPKGVIWDFGIVLWGYMRIYCRW